MKHNNLPIACSDKFYQQDMHGSSENLRQSYYYLITYLSIFLHYYQWYFSFWKRFSFSFYI